MFPPLVIVFQGCTQAKTSKNAYFRSTVHDMMSITLRIFKNSSNNSRLSQTFLPDFPSRLFVWIFWKLLSGVCLLSGFCPFFMSDVCLSERTRQRCPDFRCPCPPTKHFTQLARCKASGMIFQSPNQEDSFDLEINLPFQSLKTSSQLHPNDYDNETIYIVRLREKNTKIMIIALNCFCIRNLSIFL